ncbi:MAG TPA: VTT domain-containing protein [Patescibacteria group bacterium]|nr:VTT domain-containing protein [Patescibacteria group bacterium]
MFDLKNLIEAAGYLGLFGIVFAESGLFIGFFLPGDSLLFTAGFLASQNYLNIVWLIVIIFTAAVIGDNVGYYFGQYSGPKIFKKPESLFFKPEYLHKAQAFYEQHGGKTIILARFMPFVRTFAPIVAGAGRMDHKKFVFYNIVGGAIWTLSMLLGGYFLGKVVPNADKYVLPIVAAIIVASVAPSVIALIKSRMKNKNSVGNS